MFYTDAKRKGYLFAIKSKKKKNTFKKILSKSILNKYTCYSTVKHMVLHLTQHFWDEF